jgi:hypothetical protein
MRGNVCIGQQARCRCYQHALIKFGYGPIDKHRMAHAFTIKREQCSLIADVLPFKGDGVAWLNGICDR